MSEENQDHMEDIIKEEKIRETANEIQDGQMDTWIQENHDNLVNEFVGEWDTSFKEYCKMRWREVHE